MRAGKVYWVYKLFYLPDSDIIEQIKSGDSAAFRRLFEEYKDRVYNTSLGILQNVSDAEDTVQDVFVEIFNSIGKFRGDSSPGTWIYRITLNKCFEHIRKSKRKKRFGFIESIFGEKSESLNLPDFNHPGVIMENKERSAVLFRAVEKLNDSQKSAFVLSKIEGLSVKEISSIMNLTESSVESLLHRAKNNLKKLLSDYYNSGL